MKKNFTDCSKQLEEEAAQAEAARAAAERDSFKNRALKDMMNNTLERKAVNPLDELTREPWMDLPPNQLNAEQKKSLREFERLVQECKDQAEKERRIAEGERKSLEDEILVIIRTFNVQLSELHNVRLETVVQTCCWEQQALSLASALQLVCPTDCNFFP